MYFSIFNNLTGSYAIVSNYLGTNWRGFKTNVKIRGINREIIDTPDMYSFFL
ncbi:MAG: hypothetical protein KAJ14_15525 [Candidatus Omnitrophica bacterium]|nr:hypothetical protein [Candidatus Omnitrophota bacterium]MCK5494519.1 hypothetical protein [Candidatus Omnitrophota bacterium]